MKGGKGGSWREENLGEGKGLENRGKEVESEAEKQHQQEMMKQWWRERSGKGEENQKGGRGPQVEQERELEKKKRKKGSWKHWKKQREQKRTEGPNENNLENPSFLH